MATTFAANAVNDEEILSIALDHNVGDVALGRTPRNRREHLNNAIDLKMNIEPGELVKRSAPQENFQFAWIPFKDDDSYQDAKDAGYRPVIEAEWIKKDRWEWELQEAERKRWSETSMLVTRDSFCMFRPKKLWDDDMRMRERQNERSIQASTEKAIVSAQGHGMAVDGEVGGQKFEVPAPTRRKTVS